MGHGVISDRVATPHDFPNQHRVRFRLFPDEKEGRFGADAVEDFQELRRVLRIRAVVDREPHFVFSFETL